jgi:hypothetical protein
MQKGPRRFTLIPDRTIGIPLPLSDIDFMPDEKMSQSHPQVVGLDHEIIPESGDKTRSHPYRLGRDAATGGCSRFVTIIPPARIGELEPGG